MENQQLTEQAINDAIDQAREACKTTGDYSTECAAAWDAVEEMQTAKADRLGKERSTNSLEKYCQQRPDADECRMYDV
ncbi:Calvin cycle protein CP12 [Aerosakkonemataceae cyanobacterium BLCC-F154]|uniref:Calvin cycle protein CP12 n=1 Tax=Floridaenema fluviatile BLCC-F154 TaxID=3153640 RepID=A0ABV4Y989_9CYAN